MTILGVILIIMGLLVVIGALTAKEEELRKRRVQGVSFGLSLFVIGSILLATSGDGEQKQQDNNFGELSSVEKRLDSVFADLKLTPEKVKSGERLAYTTATVGIFVEGDLARQITILFTGARTTKEALETAVSTLLPIKKICNLTDQEGKELLQDITEFIKTKPSPPSTKTAGACNIKITSLADIGMIGVELAPK